MKKLFCVKPLKMAEEHTTINDLPTPALCNIFRFCEKHSYVAICCVCRQWLLAFVHSQFPLPALKLTAPQPEHHGWLQQFTKRLVRLSLRRVDNLSWITSASNLQVAACAVNSSCSSAAAAQQHSCGAPHALPHARHMLRFTSIFLPGCLPSNSTATL